MGLSLLDKIKNALGLDNLKNALGPASADVLKYAIIAIAGVVVFWIAWRVLRRRKQTAAPLPPDLKVNVDTLSNQGPAEGPPVLEFYHLPVRLAAIVLAPVGRVRELPPDDQLATLLDAIVPGLDKVAALHEPLIRRWPSQVSARGFAHLFFSNSRLPGPGGKGTPWSSAAGIFKVQGQPIMAGLVFRAAQPNSFGQTIVDSEDKWLGCLRVKWS
jgi:hypothetical protein